jgi:hypothetical protein
MYWDQFTIAPARESRPVHVALGRRDNVVGHTQGPFQVGGSLQTRVAPSEMDELLDITVQGNAPVTTPAMATLTRNRTYVPGTCRSQTVQFNDGAALWQAAGVQGNSFTIDGSVDGGVTFSFDLFATDIITLGALGGTPTDRTPLYLDGWQATFWMAPFGTSTFTQFTSLVLAYNFTFNNNLARVYTLNNSLAANRNALGLLEAGAQMTFDATSAQAATEISNWRTDVKKVLRLRFEGPANGIETGFNEFIQIDLPGAWMSPDMGGETQGVRSYQLPLTYVFDPNLAAGMKIVTQTARTALY